jgi:dipeptidase E
MIRIILGGGGDDKVAFESHRYFYETLGSGKKVLYIPVAMDPAKHPWASCMDWFYSAFKNFGKISVNLLTEFSGLTDNFLGQYDGIYVGGGNTFKLLKAFKDSNFDKLLKIYIERGGIYYGGSAGAIIMGKTIDTATAFDSNDVALKDLTGLNLADGFSIWPHYTSSHEKMMADWNKVNGKVVGVGEDSALVVNGKESEEIGNNILKLEDRN